MVCFVFFHLQLEQRLNEVEQFYSTANKKPPNTSKASSMTKDKDKDRHIPSVKKQQQDASRREAAAAKRMQELMRQFSSIYRQVVSNAFSIVFESLIIMLYCNCHFALYIDVLGYLNRLYV